MARRRRSSSSDGDPKSATARPTTPLTTGKEKPAATATTSRKRRRGAILVLSDDSSVVRAVDDPLPKEDPDEKAERQRQAEQQQQPTAASERRVQSGLTECFDWIQNGRLGDRPGAAAAADPSTRCSAYTATRGAADQTLRWLLQPLPDFGEDDVAGEEKGRAGDREEVDFRRQQARTVFRGLADQLSRSATSVPANLAEGDGRANGTQRVTFAKIARGSLLESIDHLRSLAALCDEAADNTATTRPAFFGPPPAEETLHPKATAAAAARAAWAAERSRLEGVWTDALTAFDDWLCGEVGRTARARVLGASKKSRSEIQGEKTEPRFENEEAS